MKQNHLLLSIICLLGIATGLTAQTVYVPQTVPNPKNATANGWVSDPSGYFSGTDLAEINEACDQLKQTVDVEVAVVMLPGYDRERYDRFDFCQELFNLWGIGGAEKNTGVLVFFADGPEGHRDIRIHTGGGMEGLITDYKCSEYIDDAYPYLEKGEFAKGVKIIVRDIYNNLMSEESQSELLLGWKPQHESPVSLLFWYILLGFAVAIRIAVRMYKKAPINDHMTEEIWDTANEGLNSRMKNIGYGSIFLWPLLLLYIAIRIIRKQMPALPIRDEEGRKLYKVPDAEAGNYLSDNQRMEQSVQSRRYNVFRSAEGDIIKTGVHKGKKANAYSECAVCGAATMGLLATKVLSEATYKKTGEKELSYKCACCGHEETLRKTIPVLVKASSGSSYSSGRSDSGYRGGWSSGSSSHSSGGSWGGGHSFGGGAGRSF